MAQEKILEESLDARTFEIAENSDSQNRQILAHLQKGNTITQMDALRMFGCMRLASRINDLRQMGFHIMTFREESIARNGKKKRYAKYALKEEVC